MSIAETSLTPRVESHRSPGMAWPIILIALGIIFLLDSSGLLSDALRQQLVQLWPFALVLLGVDLLLRGRSTAAELAADAAVVAAAVLFLALAPAPAAPIGVPAVSVARESASELNLTLSYGAGTFDLTGGASDLVNISSTQDDVRIRSVVRINSAATVNIEPNNETFPFNPGDRAWSVRIPSDLPTTLTLNLGAGEMRADLSAVRLVRATINHGASALTLIPPKPTGDVLVTMSSGASSIVIEMPPGVEYRVRMTGAVNSLSGREESAGYWQATDRLTFVITGGASSVSIH